MANCLLRCGLHPGLMRPCTRPTHARQREQVALAVAEITAPATVSQPTTIREAASADGSEMQLARTRPQWIRRLTDVCASLKAVVLQRRPRSVMTTSSLRKAGFTDAQIVEIIAKHCLDIFSNYFNRRSPGPRWISHSCSRARTRHGWNCPVKDPARTLRANLQKPQ